jgi:hypothetical protein
MITNDFAFCNSVGFHICEHCKRNIHKDSFPKDAQVWYLQPAIKMVNCENFVEKDIK